MGHNRNLSSYPENCNKALVQADWDEAAMHDGFQECNNGLPGRIIWNTDTICADREEAEKWIEEHDSDYSQLAVRYRLGKISETAKIKILTERSSEAKKKCRELENKIHYLGFKARFITCKSCGSKLNTEQITSRLKTNRCPVCKADLRPESALEKINKLREKQYAVDKELLDAYKKENAKSLKKSEIYWLVKTEFHT